MIPSWLDVLQTHCSLISFNRLQLTTIPLTYNPSQNASKRLQMQSFFKHPKTGQIGLSNKQKKPLIFPNDRSLLTLQISTTTKIHSSGTNKTHNFRPCNGTSHMIEIRRAYSFITILRMVSTCLTIYERKRKLRMNGIGAVNLFPHSLQCT